MACTPDIRRIFEEVSESAAKGILAGQAVRVLPVDGGLYLFARNFQELVLVEPRILPAGKMFLTYARRNDQRLREVLDRLAQAGKEKMDDHRRGKSRRLGNAPILA